MKDQIKLPQEAIISKIYLIRGQKIMLDHHLSELYQVETKQLKRQVRRNIQRFPDDFMFVLSPEELEDLRCQFGTSSWGGIRYAPMAFTEQGVAMLSSVLNSQTAVEVNIQIIRTFMQMREMLSTHSELLVKMEQIERRVDDQDDKMREVFKYIRSLIQKDKTAPRKGLGYKSN